QRISEMLLNETYMGNMVQGRQVKISYKSQKCRKLPAESWVVVEKTHEPLVDRETFCQVRLLVNSRKGTRSRTYDYLLKGIVYCHECGARMTVSNRRTSKGADRLFFVCKTYQRFPKAGVCSCHTIKVDTVTEAVVAKVREICRVSLDSRKLLTLAQQALEEAAGQDRTGQQMAEIRQKLRRLSAHLDRIYADRLEGLLSEEDFRRISSRTRAERQQLEFRQEALRRLPTSPKNGTCCASELVQDFLETICTSRELLLSLVDRVELDKTRHLVIRFRIAPP
ncbi:MAG: recombinase zinc beta ribbon domain-containing protein, partial [Faecalibacterium prausnitzii]|nr:recombinase zinc beta ribbon domain-containing protein [Faecalibacterium prausnitzii]